MTDNFDNFFHQILEDMTANDVANVGTGWTDDKGGIPKVLGGIQRRSGMSKKKKKKPIKEGYFVNDEEIEKLALRMAPQDKIFVDKMANTTALLTISKGYAWNIMKEIKKRGFQMIYNDRDPDSVSVIVLSKSPEIRDAFISKNKAQLGGFVVFR